MPGSVSPAAPRGEDRQRGRDGKKINAQNRRGSFQKGPSVSAVQQEEDSGSYGDIGSSRVVDSIKVFSLYVPLLSCPLLNKRTKFWLVESGAANHCAREKSLFVSFRPGKQEL